MNAQIPLSVQPLINAYFNALEPLRAHFYGIYIIGSIPLGAFEEQKSDIDIIALTQGEWTRHKLKQLKDIHTQLIHAYPLNNRLDTLYIPLRDIGKSDAEITPYPYNGKKSKFHAAGYNGLNAWEWWMIKYCSIRLSGPECSTLPLEVTWENVVMAACYKLDTYWAGRSKHPYLFLLDGWIWWTVPTLCRILSCIEDSEIISKSQALISWRDRLSAHWRLLINEAWRIGYHPHTPSLYSSPIKRARDTLAFIEYTCERGHKALATSTAVVEQGYSMYK